MATTADFKNGLTLVFNNGLYSIVQFQHVKPGKGPAFVRTKLKSLTTGRVIDNTFTAGVKVETARVERRPYQFLYSDDLGYNFMHLETFEQIALQKDLIENAELLKEGSEVEILYHTDTESPLTCTLPSFVEMEVTYTEPGFKGDTSSSTATKPATIESGGTIHVPLFVNTGDIIRIDTRTKEYVETIKK